MNNIDTIIYIGVYRYNDYGLMVPMAYGTNWLVPIL